MKRCRRLAATTLAGLVLLGAAAALARGAEASPARPNRAERVRYTAAASEGTWRKVPGPDPSLSSRELFTCALALAEAKTHPERLETLFDVAARMQDRDPQSRGYGNFRWSWANDKVMDYNAVEFCMQGGVLVWMRHREALPAGARDRLRETLDYAVEGCLRHRVRESYTNIALMNAENLILLGEALGRPPVADEGYARLDRIVMHTWENGISEYGSPCYYGVDLDCLGLIEAFCGRERGREQARALLDLFWTDIAANWFGPSLRLGGPHSRDYNYLRGNGSVLDNHLWAMGWLPGEARGGLGALWPALARWEPPARLLEMSRTRVPRLVRQSWNVAPAESRTHYLLPDVTLGSSAANYHNMDLPLTVDLPGDADFPRCYFIPDARHDPYGKVRIREGSGPHSKTLHLRPFWTAAQRTTDALAVVLYRDEDMTKDARTLESHVVVPRAVDGFWIGDEPVTPSPVKPASFPVAEGRPLVLRKGSAAVGLRVLWSRGVGGRAAPAALVEDGNPHGAVRLTVTHYEGEDALPSAAGAGAVLWVRVGSGLDSASKFDAWRRAFATADAAVQLTSADLAARVAGSDGPGAAAAALPAGGPPRLEPAPARGVLELDGEDIGRAILGKVEPVKSYLAHLAATPAVSLAPSQGVYIEAESGYALAPMTVAEDAKASGGKYAWSPGEHGGGGGDNGRLQWNLTVAADGAYYLWGRVLAPTPDDDSFFIVLAPDGKPAGAPLAWHVGTRREWTWVRFAPEGSRDPAPLRFPAGKVRLDLRTRENGTKIDRLFLTDSADARPQ